MSDMLDSPQKSLTIVIILAAIGILSITILGFFYTVKSPDLVSAASKTLDAILIGAVGGKLGLATPTNGNSNGNNGNGKQPAQ